MKIQAGGNLDSNDPWVKGASIIDLTSLGKKDTTPDYLKSSGSGVYIKDNERKTGFQPSPLTRKFKLS